MIEDRTSAVEREHHPALCAEIVAGLQIAVVVWQVVDPDDASTIRRVFANPASDASAHARPGELDGTTLGESFPALLETDIPAKMIEVARTGQAIDLGEVRYGDERIARGVYRAMAYPLPDRCVCITYDDVTARVRAEEALQVADERLRRIIAGVNEAFVSVDSRGTITEWNHEAEALFGWTRDEAIGRPVAETLVPPSLRRAHREGFERFLATSEGTMINRRVELAAIDRDGREFSIEMTVAAIEEDHGHSFHALLHDISERKEAEEALRRARDELDARVRERTAELSRANARLRKLDELKTEFVTTAAHELRTPIAIIKGGTENVLDGFHGEVAEPQRNILSIVKENAAHMAHLVDDLLDLSRMDSQVIELDLEPTDLRSPVQVAAGGLESLATQRGIRLIRHMPDAPVPAVVDGARISRVVNNLVENALEHARGEVTVKLTMLDEAARLTVEDDGPGIPDDRLETVFERFVRFAGPSGRAGTGLGLAIVDGIVKAHGGEVRAENREGAAGGGARFVISLPIRADRGEETTEDDVEPGRAGMAGGPEEGKVLR